MRQSERVPPALNSRQPLIIYHLFPEASASFWPGSLLSSPSARPADPRTGLTQSLGFHDTSSCRKAELRMTNASAAGGVSAGAHTAAVRAVQVQQPLCFCFCVFYKSLDRTKLWRRRFICLLPSVKKSGCCYCLRRAGLSEKMNFWLRRWKLGEGQPGDISVFNSGPVPLRETAEKTSGAQRALTGWWMGGDNCGGWRR